MTNPDDATTLTGLAAGLAVPVAMSTGFSSSTHGGATDAVRGDISTGLDPVTGELAMKPTAGPDIDPDHQIVSGPVDPYHSGTGIGAVDGIRPDLDVNNTGPIEKPTDTGTNPYGSSGDGRGSSSFAATAADATTQNAQTTSGVTQVGGTAGGGIHTVGAATADESGASGSAAGPAGVGAAHSTDPAHEKAGKDETHSQPAERAAPEQHSDPLGMVSVAALRNTTADPIPNLTATVHGAALDHTLAGGAFHTVVGSAIPDPDPTEMGDTNLDHGAMAHLDPGFAPDPADAAPEQHDGATPDHVDVPFGGPLEDGLD